MDQDVERAPPVGAPDEHAGPDSDPHRLGSSGSYDHGRRPDPKVGDVVRVDRGDLHGRRLVAVVVDDQLVAAGPAGTRGQGRHVREQLLEGEDLDGSLLHEYPGRVLPGRHPGGEGPLPGHHMAVAGRRESQQHLPLFAGEQRQRGRLGRRPLPHLARDLNREVVDHLAGVSDDEGQGRAISRFHLDRGVGHEDRGHHRPPLCAWAPIGRGGLRRRRDPATNSTPSRTSEPARASCMAALAPVTGRLAVLLLLLAPEPVLAA